MPRCPACSDMLFRRTIEDVETDGCPSCGGIWLDKGELHDLAKSPAALRKLDKTFVPGVQASTAERTGLCPRCSQPLVQFEFDKFRGVRLDRCKACGGIWLDHGEAGAIAARLEPQEEPQAAVVPIAAAVPEISSGLELDTEPRQLAAGAESSPWLHGPIATAVPVREVPDRGPAVWPGRFWEALHQADHLTVQQQFEIGEFFGFETRNKYAIRAELSALGWAAEQGQDALSFISRQFLGHWRSFDIVIFDELRQPMLRAFHPFRFFFQRLEVSLSDGTFLGALQQRFSLLSKRFDVLGPDGRVLMTVNSPFWRLWTFPFLRGAEQVGAVLKRWSGFFSEAFTDRDTFTVQLGPSLSDAERALLLAASIFIDLQYFERKAR